MSTDTDLSMQRLGLVRVGRQGEVASRVTIRDISTGLQDKEVDYHLAPCTQRLLHSSICALSPTKPNKLLHLAS